jgi:hypothetical protein
MTLHLIPLSFLIYEENCIFFFISVPCQENEKKGMTNKSRLSWVNLTKGHDDMLGGMEPGESEDQVGAHERVNVLHVKLA